MVGFTFVQIPLGIILVAIINEPGMQVYIDSIIQARIISESDANKSHLYGLQFSVVTLSFIVYQGSIMLCTCNGYFLGFCLEIACSGY